MLKALFLALGQVMDPPSRGVVWRGVIGALVAFAVLWVAIGHALIQLTVFDVPWIDDAIDVLGGVAVAVISWMLFPAVVVAVSGFFVDQVVDRVEAVHYPHLPTPRQVPLSWEIAAAIRLLGIGVIANLVALPVYLVTPLLNLPLYLVINGWLVSSEYFRLVAFRRVSPEETNRLRRARPAAIFLGGVAVVALSMIPLVNLLVPVIASALFVHLFHRGVGREALASG